MAQTFSQILQSINNSEIRIALEMIMNIAGIQPGDSTGPSTLAATGTLIGNVTGNVTGNLTGDQVGNMTGEQVQVSTSYAADAALAGADFATGLIKLDGTDATVGITGWTPIAGRRYLITCEDASNAVTLQLTSGIVFNGSGDDIATFDAALETIEVYCISATNLIVLSNVGSVAFSTAV